MLWCRGSGIASKARGIRAVAWASIPKLLKVKSVVQTSEASRPDGKAILQGRRAQAQHYAMQRLLAIALGSGSKVAPFSAHFVEDRLWVEGLSDSGTSLASGSLNIAQQGYLLQ